MDGLAEDESCRCRPPKSVQEEDSLLVQSKLKSTQYKVEVFRTWQAAREQKFCIRGFLYSKLVETLTSMNCTKFSRLLCQ